MLSQIDVVLTHLLIDIHSVHTWVVHVASVLGCCHVEDRRGLARVIDDDVVDVIVVYYVRDVPTLRFRLDSLLRVTRRRSTASHTETLAIRISCSLETPLILALLRHGVFSKFLRTSERSLLIIAITIDKVVAFLGPVLL